VVGVVGKGLALDVVLRFMALQRNQVFVGYFLTALYFLTFSFNRGAAGRHGVKVTLLIVRFFLFFYSVAIFSLGHLHFFKGLISPELFNPFLPLLLQIPDFLPF
jgi:hypothetical protein